MRVGTKPSKYIKVDLLGSRFIIFTTSYSHHACVVVRLVLRVDLDKEKDLNWVSIKTSANNSWLLNE